MNAIPVIQISQGITFSDDSYILNDLFFLPKNFPVLSYHLKLLNEWNISTLFTNGTMFKKFKKDHLGKNRYSTIK